METNQPSQRRSGKRDDEPHQAEPTQAHSASSSAASLSPSPHAAGALPPASDDEPAPAAALAPQVHAAQRGHRQQQTMSQQQQQPQPHQAAASATAAATAASPSPVAPSLRDPQPIAPCANGTFPTPPPVASGHGAWSVEMLSKVPLQASWPRPDTPYPLQLAQQNAATSLSASPPGGHPPAGQPSVTPIPQTSQQIAQQALQLYAIVSRSAEDFAHPASALAWLARARPARTGKITVPPENRWPKSVHGAGGYMDAFRAVGLTQRVHETKLGHWHWWYYDPKRVCLEALQLALTRRWRESQLRTSYPSTQSDLQTVSPPSTPMPHPQQTHSQPPSQMPLMQQQPPPMQQQPQHQQQQLLYDPSQNVYYTHPQATVYTTYSMMPPQAPPPQMMMSPDPLSMAGYPSYLQQQPTYQMQQRAERMYARMTQLDQQSMEMLYAQQQEQQRALQVQQLHLQALQRANTNGLNYAPSHPPSASQGLQQSTSTLFQPYQKTHPLPSPNEDGTAGPPPNLQTQQHQQAMAQLMQGSATGSTMNAHTATAASSSTIAVRPASDGSIYTPLALPPLESLTESASPSSLAVRNGTAATLALFNAAGGMHGGLQLGKTGKEGEMMGSGVGESAPATMSPTRSESIKLQPVQMQLQMQPQQPHHHRQQQHSSSDGKSPSAFFLRPSASLQYSGYPMVPLSNPQMLDPNSYYTGTYLQQNQQGQVQYAPYQPMQYLPQQAPLEFIQHQQQHPQRPLQLMTLQPQTSAPAPSNHTVPPQQHQLAQPISTTSS